MNYKRDFRNGIDHLIEASLFSVLVWIPIAAIVSYIALPYVLLIKFARWRV